MSSYMNEDATINERFDNVVFTLPVSDAEREARKPDISRLPNALSATGQPCFRKGEKIVIERRSVTLPGTPYLDTRTYRVVGINLDNGNLDLFDETVSQQAMSNYIKGQKLGFVFKLAKGNLVGTKKLGRPRKNPIVDEVEAAAAKKTATHVVKKGRGRPPGAKNRDKSVIRAEKKLKMTEQFERKAKRAAKAKRSGKPIPKSSAKKGKTK